MLILNHYELRNVALEGNKHIEVKGRAVDRL